MSKIKKANWEEIESGELDLTVPHSDSEKGELGG